MFFCQKQELYRGTKRRAVKDLSENNFHNIFVNEENKKLYVETRVDATSQGSGEILLGEQVSDRSGTGENQDRQGLRNEVGNRMSQNKNAVSQEGLVSEAIERSFGAKERNKSINTAEGKSISIKGYPEELFESKSDVEGKGY